MQDIFHIKMYEYMAMRKLVITTRHPGVIREFGEGNGVVYVERTEDVVPKAIELIQTGQLSELGQKAHRFVEQNSRLFFTWRRSLPIRTPSTIRKATCWSTAWAH